MKVNRVHPFSLNLAQMKEIQSSLRKEIEQIPYPDVPKRVSGVDLAYYDNQAIAVIVVMEYESKEIIETVTYTDQVSIEYIPGFLAFRELPIFLKAWEQVKSDPDLVFFDGNGILHPERMGLATHASFFIQKPTIGIAKTHFIGIYREPDPVKGSVQLISDQGEVIGAVVRTQADVKPIYVSVGNWVRLQEAIEFTFHFVGSHSRIPEITRQADILTRKLKKEATP